MNGDRTNNKRRVIFALILAAGIGIDMISTHLLVASGYREMTGLIVMMLSVSEWMLYAYVAFMGAIAYILYPLMDRLRITTHFETICLLQAVFSVMAATGNFYLYMQYGGI